MGRFCIPPVDRFWERLLASSGQDSRRRREGERMTRTTSRPNQLEAEYLERKAQIRADGNLGWEEKESSIKALRGRISPSTGKEAPGEYSGRSVQHPNQ